MKQRRLGTAGIFTVLTVLLLTSTVLSLLLGSTNLSLAEVVRSAQAGDRSNPAWRIFFYVRLPRTLGGILCGSGLAVSGAVLQVVLNNSLAGPNVIGVNAGAGFAVLLMMSLFPEKMTALPMAAFLGALACTLLIYAVARCTGTSRMTLVLSGVAVSGVLNAAASGLKIVFPDVLAAYNRFSVGSLEAVTMAEIRAAVPYLLVGLTAAVFLSSDMNVLALGEEVAQSLGLKAERCRIVLILTASLLAGAAVSFAGLVGFVGLLMPHIARLLTGGDNRIVIPASALLGASGVLLCDLMGRMIAAPFELPVGLVLSLIGGISFLILLLRKKGGKLHD